MLCIYNVNISIELLYFINIYLVQFVMLSNVNTDMSKNTNPCLNLIQIDNGAFEIVRVRILGTNFKIQSQPRFANSNLKHS